MAVAHSQALLVKGQPPDRGGRRDMSDPEAILAHDGIRRAGFSLDAPTWALQVLANSWPASPLPHPMETITWRAGESSMIVGAVARRP